MLIWVNSRNLRDLSGEFILVALTALSYAYHVRAQIYHLHQTTRMLQIRQERYPEGPSSRDRAAILDTKRTLPLERQCRLVGVLSGEVPVREWMGERDSIDGRCQSILAGCVQGVA
jgi:hypothetical protein